MYTEQQINNWVGSDYRRLNMLSVARASRGVYDFLVKNYGFGFRWAKGNEEIEANSNTMVDWLNREADRTGKPMDFARMVNASLPVGGLYSDNNIINRVEKLFRDNP